MCKINTWLIVTATFLCHCLAKKCRTQFDPAYHFCPSHGWMNDPNGFSIFNDKYQLFFQYNPESSQEAGIARWGHAESNDLVHWEHLPIAMEPDKSYDKTGVFSGSAIPVNDTLYLFYTGNVNYPGENPDHIQRQALAYTTDGVNVTKYENNPIIMGEDYQPNIRDPKVWKDGDTYYMVLGNSLNNKIGRVLLYKSENLTSWEMVSILGQSNGSLGYMWECPDFFPLGDYWVLLFSPQGVEPQGDNFQNLYQTGYIIGYLNDTTMEFTAVTDFKELDHGHDFYATQTLSDSKNLNRRIVIAWMDMWEQVYPERNEGWTGQMTLIRSLELTSDLTIRQIPIKEYESARKKLLYSGCAGPKTEVKLNDNTAEILIQSNSNEDFELILEANNTKLTILYNYTNATVTLDRGGTDGIRRTKWTPKNMLKFHIFVDRSSVELFCGDGEVTFSSRFFPECEITLKLGGKSKVNKLLVYDMKRTVPKPNVSCNSTAST